MDDCVSIRMSMLIRKEKREGERERGGFKIFCHAVLMIMNTNIEK